MGGLIRRRILARDASLEYQPPHPVARQAPIAGAFGNAVAGPELLAIARLAAWAVGYNRRSEVFGLWAR
jgi:hypothetical protein